MLLAGQYDQLNLGDTGSLEEVARQIQSYVDAHSDVSCGSWKDAKHFSSRMTAADVIVRALREDVLRRTRHERAEDPVFFFRRAWAKQRVHHPTGPYPAPVEFEDAAGRKAKDGMKGRGKGKRNKGGQRAVVAELLVFGKLATLTTKLCHQCVWDASVRGVRCRRGSLLLLLFGQYCLRFSNKHS